MKYLIWSYDYSHASAGQKVLHRLAHELRLIGEEAYVGPWATNPEWDTPHIPFDLTTISEGEWCAVYPEIVPGNPWDAPVVARWVLNSPGLLGGDPEYPDSEIVFSYSPTFSDAQPLYLPAVELDIYTDRHEPRQGSAVYVGKGIEDQAILGATRITLEMREDRHALADVLNRVSLLYSFDAVSGMNDIARLCGCRVEILSDRYRHRAELTGMDWTGVGFGYTPPEFDSAEFRARYEASVETFRREQLPAFVRATSLVPA